jgi:hypothetical protein
MGYTMAIIRVRFEKLVTVLHFSSYFDEKKILLYFHYQRGPLPKKGRNFFSHQNRTIYTPIDSPCQV